ncbi:MAG: rhodanese-like domain-containing protein [Planctomycetota bacterium]
MSTITAQGLAARLADAPALDLVDVRTPAEFRAVHLHHARSIPLNAVSATAVRASRPADAAGPTYVICKAGPRAKQAAAKLAQQDPSLDLVIVEGGIDAAVAAGLDAVRGRAAMSLERQVRIAAGSLVALGTAAGVFVSPWALIVPGFVGCGLVFAGLTNTCGMGMLLARMPWNR